MIAVVWRPPSMVRRPSAIIIPIVVSSRRRARPVAIPGWRAIAPPVVHAAGAQTTAAAVAVATLAAETLRKSLHADKTRRQTTRAARARIACIFEARSRPGLTCAACTMQPAAEQEVLPSPRLPGGILKKRPRASCSEAEDALNRRGLRVKIGPSETRCIPPYTEGEKLLLFYTEDHFVSFEEDRNRKPGRAPRKRGSRRWLSAAGRRAAATDARAALAALEYGFTCNDENSPPPLQQGGGRRSIAAEGAMGAVEQQQEEDHEQEHAVEEVAAEAAVAVAANVEEVAAEVAAEEEEAPPTRLPERDGSGDAASSASSVDACPRVEPRSADAPQAERRDARPPAVMPSSIEELKRQIQEVARSRRARLGGAMVDLLSRP